MVSYNQKQANKGRAFEEMIKYQNNLYLHRGTAYIQKISTPWVVVRKSNKIISAFPEGKSTLDFRGTIKGGYSVSFDAKEVTKTDKGFPLSYIEEHQVNYIRQVLPLNEISFLLCHIKPIDKFYIVDGGVVISAWDNWKKNKGLHGYNLIPIKNMCEIKQTKGNILDYISMIKLTKE